MAVQVPTLAVMYHPAFALRGSLSLELLGSTCVPRSPPGPGPTSRPGGEPAAVVVFLDGDGDCRSQPA